MFFRDSFGCFPYLIRHAVGLAAQDVRVAATVGRFNDRFIAKGYACEAWKCLGRLDFHVFARGAEGTSVLGKGECVSGTFTVAFSVVGLTLFVSYREGRHEIVLAVGPRV